MKSILTLCFVLLLIQIKAQQIGEHKVLGSTIATLTQEDKILVLTYRDFRFKDSKEYLTVKIESISVDSLYSEIEAVFVNKKNRDYYKTIDVGKYQLTISYHREMGETTAKITLITGGYFFLNKKGLNKLFGR